MEQSKEVQLAYEIARALNDLHSIDWHIGVCKKYSSNPEFLREKVQYILSRTDIDNPAKYYTRVMTYYVKHSRG